MQKKWFKSSLPVFLSAILFFNPYVATSETIEKISQKRKEKPHAISTNFELTIIHTNDTHAMLDNIARRATAIEGLRKESRNALLLDAGDVFSGSLFFTKYKGLADLYFMNMLHYDAMTFGNHEFDKTSKVLANFVRKANFPLLTSNIDFSKDNDLGSLVNDKIKAMKTGVIVPSVIKEINGEQIGIIAVTTADTRLLSSPASTIRFDDVVESAQAEIDSLVEKGITKIIALTHVGFEEDQRMAKELENLDIIVGGHSHTVVIEPVMICNGNNKTLIVQAGAQSEFLGKLDVVFDELGKIKAYEGHLINLNQKDTKGNYVIKEQGNFAEKLKEFQKPLEEYRQKKVGYTDVFLDGERQNVRSNETNLGNLIADAMIYQAKKTRPETTIAFQNSGSIRNSIGRGVITLGEIVTVMPYANMLVTVELTPTELRDTLEHSVSKLPAPDGRFLQVSGLKFVYDVTKPVGSRVEAIQVVENGKYVPFQNKKNYYVTTNAFLANGGDGFTALKKAKDANRMTEEYIVDYEVVINYLKSFRIVSPTTEGRISEVVENKK